MALYMLDTDISSYIMKRSHKAVLSRLRAAAIQDVCISVITKSELMYGIAISPHQSQDQAALDEFLRYVEVLAYDDVAVPYYAQIRAELKTGGTPIGANDLFIATHAQSLGLILVTNNMREFRRIKGLQVENWTEGA